MTTKIDCSLQIQQTKLNDMDKQQICEIQDWFLGVSSSIPFEANVGLLPKETKLGKRFRIRGWKTIASIWFFPEKCNSLNIQIASDPQAVRILYRSVLLYCHLPLGHTASEAHAPTWTSHHSFFLFICLYYYFLSYYNSRISLPFLLFLTEAPRRKPWCYW